jgi:ApaG protein
VIAWLVPPCGVKMPRVPPQKVPGRPELQVRSLHGGCAIIRVLEHMPSSEAITRNIRVRVQSQYDPSRSSPQQSRWFFLYTVKITNEGPDTVQLMSRHWVITDGMGKVEEVIGPGVVGNQPVLAPGQSFEYTSGCPLTTPFGSMHGTYQMVKRGAAIKQGEEQFEIEIAPFTLTEPYTSVN